MKKIIALILCVTILLSFPVVPLKASAAQEGYYTYEISNNEATITDVDTSISGDIVIPRALGGYPVTRIGNYAFRYCGSLTSIMIPYGVTSIGNYAFLDCTGLTNISISDSVTSINTHAFFGCTSLTGITIPDSVTSIGNYAFHSCTGLTSVTLPDGMISIGDAVFSHCSSLTDITIPSGVTSIGDYAFSGCSGLTGITIPDSVIKIGYQAFYNCNSLTMVTLGNSVETIGNYAFSHCTSLTGITIPDSVTSIGEWTFSSCDNLTSITIPTSVSYIGDYAIRSCNSLTDVYYAGTKAQWVMIEKGENIYSLETVTIHFNHVHDFTRFAPVSVQYCDQEGYTEYTCVYGEKHRVFMPALGHDSSVPVETVAPTCESDGYTVMKCSRCNETVKVDYVAAHGHAYQGAVCTVCGDATNVITTIAIKTLPSKLYYRVDDTLDLSGLSILTTRKNGDTEIVTKGLVVSGFDSNTVGDKVITVTYEGGSTEFVVTVLSKDAQVIDYAGNTYHALSTAVQAVASGSKLTMLADITEDITINKAIALDLNGYDINGTLVIANGITLYGLDSQTDDYTVRDDFGCGKIKNVVCEGTGKLLGLPEESNVADDGYMMIAGNDGMSFHRVNLQLTAMTLRPDDVGLYFKSDFAGDELVAERVKTFGVALSIKSEPNAQNLETECGYSYFEGFTAGENNKDATSTLLYGIMDENKPDLINKRNANLQVYGRAYIQLADGSYLFGAVRSRSLKEQTEWIDVMWKILDVEQKEAVMSMYQAFSTIMKNWDIPSIILEAKG